MRSTSRVKGGDWRVRMASTMVGDSPAFFASAAWA